MFVAMAKIDFRNNSKMNILLFQLFLLKKQTFFMFKNRYTGNQRRGENNKTKARLMCLYIFIYKNIYYFN